MAEYKEKFIIISKKHLEKLPVGLKNRLAQLLSEISKLKTEAVSLLNKRFYNTTEYTYGMTERIVECIISASILEIANLNSKN